jgi:hypothetical protein
MSLLKLLADMNLSPEWIALLQASGFEAVHWSTVGNPQAEDSEIICWARENGFAVIYSRLRFRNCIGLDKRAGPQRASGADAGRYRECDWNTHRHHSSPFRTRVAVGSADCC